MGPNGTFGETGKPGPKVSMWGKTSVFDFNESWGWGE